MTGISECQAALPQPSLLEKLGTGLLKIVYSWPYKAPMTVEELSFRLREDLGARHDGRPNPLRW